MLVFKVHAVKSPYMENFRGWRMKLAHLNSSGWHGRPSFQGKFLVAQSSDFTEYPSQLAQLLFIQEYARHEVVEILGEEEQ